MDALINMLSDNFAVKDEEFSYKTEFISNTPFPEKLLPHDITVKSEGYFLDMLRCFAVNK